MNRRNVLLGLGTIVAGGGAALGSGAFSQAEAQRSVSVSLEGDSSGLLRPTVNDGDYEGVDSNTTTESDNGSVSITQINFVGINDESVFAFDDVLTIGLQDESGNEVSGTFDISISTDSGSVAVYRDSFPTDGSRGDVTDAELGTISASDSGSATDGSSVSAGIAINTNSTNSDDRFDGTLNEDSTADITITAQQQDS
ncbi:hypothetical protein Natpe_0333 [Natrinema pellirubrum DSM 15624]|uniref:DUF1102 domain-containing protein n=2 Tax=Natrinema pellirubrum TaxID=69525 RepID=L0JFF7_NATP1|nr:hypothetical protein Natpe_0333 [Natrinema pellirubrum DSM 15624]